MCGDATNLLARDIVFPCCPYKIYLGGEFVAPKTKYMLIFTTQHGIPTYIHQWDLVEGFDCPPKPADLP